MEGGLAHPRLFSCLRFSLITLQACSHGALQSADALPQPNLCRLCSSLSGTLGSVHQCFIVLLGIGTLRSYHVLKLALIIWLALPGKASQLVTGHEAALTLDSLSPNDGAMHNPHLDITPPPLPSPPLPFLHGATRESQGTYRIKHEGGRWSCCEMGWTWRHKRDGVQHEDRPRPHAVTTT
jgi:hypothetical protein